MIDETLRAELHDYIRTRHPDIPAAAVVEFANEWINNVGGELNVEWALRNGNDAGHFQRDAAAVAVEATLSLKPAVAEEKHPPTVPANSAPTSGKPFSSLSIEDQRAVVCDRFDTDPSKLLTSDFKRYRQAILDAERAPQSSASAKRRPPPEQNTVKVVDGIRTDSADWARLSPNERIRRERAARATRK